MVDSRKRRREHVDENCEVLEDAGEDRSEESEEAQEVVDLAEVRVNEDEIEWSTEEEAVFEEEGGDLDLEQGRQGREKEMNYFVKTFRMFEFGGKKRRRKQRLRPRRNASTECRRPTSVVRCRLVARDLKPQGEGPRDDLFAVMLALEAKKALFLRTLQGWAKRDENKVRTNEGHVMDVKRRKRTST